MATTSLWDVKGSLRKLLTYVMNGDKTEEMLYVSGINCLPNEHTVDEMNETKKQFGKTGGIVAFHGYQAFAPGELEPDQAHEIGVRLAEKLWGDRFEIVVSTHLDRGHLHNHIAINSVSFIDGKRFHRSNKAYQDMRDVSDRLCKEYGLSVIENPTTGKTKHYGEWKAEREGKETWRGLIKKDIDEAIDHAMTDKQFFSNLRTIGYEVKVGKDISVRPPGKERFVRLARSFGEDYTYTAICDRILAHYRVRIPIPKQSNTTPRHKKLPPVFRGSIINLYRHYLYLFGFYQNGSNSDARMHFLLREDIAKFKRITAEAAFLERASITTDKDLSLYQVQAESNIDALIAERKQIKAAERRVREGDKTIPPNSRLTEITEELKGLRKEVRQCQSIRSRSVLLAEKIERIEHEEEQERKEETRNGRIRSSGRTNRPYNTTRQ